MSLSDAELGWLEEYILVLQLLSQGNAIDEESIDNLTQAALRRFTNNHQHVAATLLLTGTASFFLGKPEVAEKCFKDARKIADSAIEEWVLDSIHMGGLCGLVAKYLNERNFDEADFYCDKINEILAREPSLSQSLPWKIFLMLGERYYLTKDYDKAHDYFFKSAVNLNKQPKTYSSYSDLSFVQARLALTLYLQDEQEESFKVLQSALAICEQNNLPLTEIHTACGNILAGIFKSKGETREAELYYNYSFTGIQDLYGLNDIITTESLNYMANYYLNCSDWSKAFDLLKESLASINKRLEAEQTLWILHNLIEICSMTENFELQEEYYDLLDQVYQREFKGEFPSDRSLVEKGDKGSALKRQEQYKSTVQEVKDRYDNDEHPQVKVALDTTSANVWTDPILSAAKFYALNLINLKSSHSDLPISESILKERDDLISTAEKSEVRIANPWKETVEMCIQQEKTADAIALLEAFKQYEQKENGEESSKLAPIIESLADIYEKMSGPSIAKPLRLKSQLLALNA